MNAWRVKKNQPFNLVIHKVFIIYEPCYFNRMKSLESDFLQITLMKDKNLLYIINKRQISFIDY
jgi:hypothetical protein